MNIYVEPGEYELLNVGDFAMQSTALERLQQLFENARLYTTTSNPERLNSFFPNVAPVCSENRASFYSSKILGERKSVILPKRLTHSKNLATSLRKFAPGLRNNLLPKSPGKEPRNGSSARNFWRSFQEADLLVVSGGGFINDEFENHALKILESIELAVNKKIPVVLFGQMIGPITKPNLLKRTAEVLKQVSFIGLREGLKSPLLAKQIGLQPERMLVTGDDAVEMAFMSKKDEIGSLIGLNFRVINYSGVGFEDAKMITGAMTKLAEDLKTQIVPVPILLADKASDLEVLKKLLKVSASDEHDLKSPQAVIERIGECRVVVTGSYHCAVFALAQGIPAVCLAKNQYYTDKFEGLADQFKKGCAVLNLEDREIAVKFRETFQNLWNQAPQLKSILIEDAKRQIELSKSAYHKISSLITINA